MRHFSSWPRCSSCRRCSSPTAACSPSAATSSTSASSRRSSPIRCLPRARRGTRPRTARATAAAVIAAIVSLQLGAAGRRARDRRLRHLGAAARTFLLFMLPIHLAIGIVEGLVTAAVISFVRAARPDMLPTAWLPSTPCAGVGRRAFLVVALALGGVGAWFASKNPDGLEWSVARRHRRTAKPDSPQTARPGCLGRAASSGCMSWLCDFGTRRFVPPADRHRVRSPWRGQRSCWATPLAGVVGGLNRRLRSHCSSASP